MAHEYLKQLTVFIDQIKGERYDNIPLVCKHFFSGAALYANNRICITLTPVGLGVKLPPQSREKLLDSNQAIALKYFPKGPIKNDYVLFPDGLKTENKLSSGYALESIYYVLGLPDPKTKNTIVDNQ